MIKKTTAINEKPFMSQGQNKDEEKYNIKISITLEKNGCVEDYKVFATQIDGWNISFYYYLFLLNDLNVFLYSIKQKFKYNSQGEK